MHSGHAEAQASWRAPLRQLANRQGGLYLFVWCRSSNAVFAPECVCPPSRAPAVNTPLLTAVGWSTRSVNWGGQEIRSSHTVNSGHQVVFFRRQEGPAVNSVGQLGRSTRLVNSSGQNQRSSYTCRSGNQLGRPTRRVQRRRPLRNVFREIQSATIYPMTAGPAQRRFAPEFVSGMRCAVCTEEPVLCNSCPLPPELVLNLRIQVRLWLPS